MSQEKLQSWEAPRGPFHDVFFIPAGTRRAETWPNVKVFLDKFQNHKIPVGAPVSFSLVSVFLSPSRRFQGLHVPSGGSGISRSASLFIHGVWHSWCLFQLSKTHLLQSWENLSHYSCDNLLPTFSLLVVIIIITIWSTRPSLPPLDLLEGYQFSYLSTLLSFCSVFICIFQL